MKKSYIKNRLICLVLSMLFLVQGFITMACDNGNNKTKGNIKIEFLNVNGKYAVEISGEGIRWNNLDTGVFGVSVSYDDISSVEEKEYVYYDEYTKIDGGYQATANIITGDGSGFSTEDTYCIRDNSVEIVRTFTVTKKGSGEGFTTYYPIRDSSEGRVEDRMWFAPGSYYGNKEYNFFGIGIKIGFSEEAVAPVDILSAPVISNYINGVSFSIIDHTEGYRETVTSDYTAKYSSIIVDERFNIPGIGLKNTYDDVERVEMFYTYPSHTYNFINTKPFTYNYRMLPIEVGLTRQCAFEIKVDKHENFNKAVDEIWRDVYEEYSVIERKYSPLSVYEALTSNLYNNYGYINNVPQYMTNSDHPLPESGFLYRNVDLAYLMIAAGYRLNKPEYIEQANELIAYHISKDLIVDNSVNKLERAEAEGVVSLLNAYKTHLLHGVDKSDWLAYVLRKTAQKGEVMHQMDIPLYLAVAEYTKDPSYIEKAKEIIEEFEETHNDFYYTGAIVNQAVDAIPSRESGIIYLNIYLNMYKLTGESQYLEKAKNCELYVESNLLIQNIDMEGEDATGYEVLSDGKFREVGVGNEGIRPYGLSWISGQSNSADNFAASSLPDLLYLYEVTKEERYKEMADYLVTNTTLYVNMGDKNWLMDDIRYSTGYGFQNEYFGISSTTDTTAAGRGSMHTSNLAWNMYVVLYALEQYAEYDSNFLVDTVIPYDTSVLTRTTASSEKNTIYRPYNATDKNPNTAWKPSDEDNDKILDIDLLEFVSINEINIDSVGINKMTIYSSSDGVSYKEIGEYSKNIKVNGTYKYIRIKIEDMEKDGYIRDVDVIGNPIVKKNYALNINTKVSGMEISEMTDWNYSTAWMSDKEEETILIDLGEIRPVIEICMMFGINLNFLGQDYVSLPVSKTTYAYKIEYSNTGDIWKEYVNRLDEPKAMAVYNENTYVRARYLKITARVNKGNLKVTEIKVYGY